LKNLPTKLINLTPANIKYYNDLHRFICIPAGRRSRKDLIGVRKMLVDPERGAFNVHNQLYIFAAPTHAQAKQVFWEILKKDTKLFQTKVSESYRQIDLINGSRLMVVGLDKPERIEGMTYPPLRGILITEMPNVKAKAWESHIRPMLSDNNGFAILNGVPEGMNHWYDRCLYACNGVMPKIVPGVGAYAENGQWSFHSWHSADVLPAEEIEEAKRTMDERTFRQEYEASFENAEGLAYYAFSKYNKKACEFNKKINLDIGMDFNVNPMCATEGHIRDGAYYQHDESVLVNSNTYEMVTHLINRYDLKKNEHGFFPATIYPDATGKARESNATHTDLQILRKAGFVVKARNANPLQRDRINSMNSAMNPMEGTPRYYVDARCRNTIDDFAKVQRMADGRLDKDQEEIGKARVHVTDALGYLIDYNFPIKDFDKWSSR